MPFMCQNLPKNMLNHAKIKECTAEVQFRATAKSRLLRGLEGLGCGCESYYDCHQQY